MSGEPTGEGGQTQSKNMEQQFPRRREPFSEDRFFASQQPKTSGPETTPRRFPRLPDEKQYQITVEKSNPAETFAETARRLMSSTLKSIRENAGEAGLPFTPEQEQQLLQGIQEELKSAEIAQPQTPTVDQQPNMPPTPKSTEAALKDLMNQALDDHERFPQASRSYGPNGPETGGERNVRIAAEQAGLTPEQRKALWTQVREERKEKSAAANTPTSINNPPPTPPAETVPSPAPQDNNPPPQIFRTRQ